MEFEPTRAQREYLRARLDAPGGTQEGHAKAAGVGRSTVARWMGDDGFRAWVAAEERRVAREYVEPMLLRLEELARTAEDQGTAIRAIDVFLRHLPGRDAGSPADGAMTAILERLVARPQVAVQVVTGGSAGKSEAAERMERMALAGGVLSLSRGVGAPPEEVRPVEPVGVAVAFVKAAEREMAALEPERVEPAKEPEPEKATVTEITDMAWADGIRKSKHGGGDAD